MTHLLNAITPLIICYDVDVTLFASPIGWSVGLAATILLYVVEKKWGHHRLVCFVRSPLMACWLLSLMTLCCVIGGSIPGWSRFSTSLPFVLLLTMLTAHLALVVIHRLRSFSLQRDSDFILIHGGLWLALFSSIVGAGDMKELQAIVDRSQETTFALNRQRARMEPLGYSLRLKDFKTVTNAADGSPVQYSATIWVNDTSRKLAVNSPCPVRWDEDIYLMNFETDPMSGKVSSCLLQVVHQPWKYVTLAGIAMLFAGTICMILKRKRKEVAT